MTSTEKIFYWLPRVLSIGFVLFISVFALDVFSEYSGAHAIIPLLIHLLPSFALIIAIIVAWKYDLVGVVIFIGFAIWYLIAFGLDRPWSWYAAIPAPAVLIGILFLVSWFQKQSYR